MPGSSHVTKQSKKSNFLKITLSIPANSADVAGWIRFLRQMKVSKIFARLTDKRQKGKICYSSSSLMHWALSACAFRLGSKNALQTSLDHLSSEQSQGMFNCLEIDNKRFPHSSTVDHFLSHTSLEELQAIPFTLIKQLEEGKFFYNHLELLPNNSLTIGCDGFWLHTYDHPHAANEDGLNACPYCLPRTYFKGTDKETTRWVHVMITFVLICQGLTLPLFVHPLKAGEVDPCQSDEKLKEESELKAAHMILPLIREKFPRAKITFLGDALYANRPIIRLCEHLNIDYLIVLKDNNLKKLNSKCQELSKTDIYQKSYQFRDQLPCKEGTLHREAFWFNNVAAGEEVFTNVLKYQETIHKSNGASQAGYEGAWISSQKIKNTNCFKKTKIGRMRWNQEDFHNTGKNRGYEMTHDMARTRPHLLIAWKTISFIAYFLFELFQHTTFALTALKNRSLKRFAQNLFEQLVHMSWGIISQSPILKKQKVQFRYRFDSS
ncbi:MAG: hypothetical protein LVR00_08185 [Rhabdochlamydiaceae bacterium]|jgi:hypothetical protein